MLQVSRFLRVLAASDIRFLTNVAERLHEEQLHVYQPGSRRAAAALILRFGDDDQREIHKAMASWQAARKLGRHAARASTSSSFYDDASEEQEKETTRLRGLRDLMSTDASTSFSSSVPGVSGASSFASTTDFLLHLVDRVGISDVKPSSLKLLFMKRADRVASRWSGQIAFPGGQRDPDEDADDLHTVQREVYEELGMPLDNANEFVCLGRMRDHVLLSNSLTGFGTARSLALTTSSMAGTQGVVQAQFVYLHVGEMTPSVKLATHEVESVQWMPLTRLSPRFVSPDSVCHALNSFVYTNDADKRLILSEFFHGAMLAFPSISMPAPPSSSSSASSSASHSASYTPRGSWRVWGQTLRAASALVMLDDRPPIDWPLFSAKNAPVVQCVVVNALHGYYEVCLAAYRVRAAYRFRTWFAPRRTTTTPFPPSSWSSVSEKTFAAYWHGSQMQRRYVVLPTGANPLLFLVPEEITFGHVACFFLDIALVLLCAYLVAALIYTIATAFRIALGWEDDARGSEARRLAYHATQIPPSLERERRLFAARRRDAATDGTHEEVVDVDAPLVKQEPSKTPSVETAVASEDALAELLSVSESDTTSSSSSKAKGPTQQRTPASQTSTSNPIIVQFDLVGTLFLLSLLLLAWKLLKAMTRIDWLGTFEDDETLLRRAEGGGQAHSRHATSASLADGLSWQDKVEHVLNSTLQCLRLERARTRRLSAQFRKGVHDWVVASGQAHSEDRKAIIDLVPMTDPQTQTQRDAQPRSTWRESALVANIVTWSAPVVQKMEDGLNAIAHFVVETVDDINVRDVLAMLERALRDREQRLFHAGYYTNDGLLARAWLYQNKGASAAGKAAPRQDWHPLGTPSRIREERAVQKEMANLRSVEAFLAQHPDVPGFPAVRTQLQYITTAKPEFSVWRWARDREAAKKFRRRTAGKDEHQQHQKVRATYFEDF